MTINIWTNPSRGSYQSTFSLSKNKNKIGKSTIPIIEDLRKFFGKQVGKHFLTSKIKKEVIQEGRGKRKELEESGKGKSITIQGPNTQIEAFAIKSNTPSDKWIVVFNGMGDQFDNHIAALHKLAQDTKVNIITFDYRGSGASKKKENSSATSAADLVEDGKMVLDYVQNGLNVDPKNIMLYGHSMGGGVAAEIHAEIDHQGPLLSESSFSCFAAAVSVKSSKIASFILEFLGWNLKAVKAFEKTEKKGVIVNRRDQTIAYRQASLYKKLMKKPGTEIHRIKIGVKPEKESLEFPFTKHGPKKSQDKSGKIRAKSTKEKSEYSQTMANLKKKRLIHLIQHPHERIMDRLIKPMKESNDEDVIALRKKFRQEDEHAYSAIVHLIEELWK